MLKVYFGAPLFSEAELMYNEYVVDAIYEHFGLNVEDPDDDIEIFLPQDAMGINDKSQFADSITIAQYDTKELLSSDIMIAVLDGAYMDAGVSAEVGIAFQAGIPVIGLFTDSRQQGTDNEQKVEALINHRGENQFIYANLFVIGLIKQNGKLVDNVEDLASEVVRIYEEM